MSYKQYDIWIADLNPTRGTEPGKNRPVLIVQTDLLNKFHASTIVCPLTTNVRKNVSALRINLSKGQAGLAKDSSIMIDQIRSIDNRRFVKRVGKLPSNLASKVEENIRLILDLE
jgi:mRNA interferase MazF